MANYSTEMLLVLVAAAAAATSSFLCYVVVLWRRNSLVTDWPFVRMLPGLIRNAGRVQEFATDLLKASGGTFQFRGPWFANMDMLVTCDPANIHYILSKNFSNYPKGPEFNKYFDILGDGIFNADYELWEIHRTTTMSLMNNANFSRLVEKTSWDKVEKGLLLVLDGISKLGTEVDLQELFQRFSFDSICILLFGQDPRSLSTTLPWIPCEKAFISVEKAMMYRHILPEICWKLQKWLQIGLEKELDMASVAFDQFILDRVTQKAEESSKTKSEMEKEEQEHEEGLLPAFMKAYKGNGGASGDFVKFLRDTLLSLMFAGRGTTSSALSWFFWLLSRNPLVETKIREEIKTKLQVSKENWRHFNAEESCKLVYLHGALCEALRLFPPVSLEHKAPIKEDILPSGHRVDQNTKTLLSFFSMGRMETIWGEDCLEFKPERWITARGGIKREPSYKFPAFHAGPRTCLGKEMAFVQMKIVAASIICNYRIQVVEGHPISPSDSVILSMKYGLMVNVTKGSV